MRSSMRSSMRRGDVVGLNGSGSYKHKIGSPKTRHLAEVPFLSTHLGAVQLRCWGQNQVQSVGTYLEDQGLPPIGSSEWTNLWRIYLKPWFWRVWIVQELCLASNCVFVCEPVVLAEQLVLGVAAKLAYTNVFHVRLAAGLSPREQRAATF